MKRIYVKIEKMVKKNKKIEKKLQKEGNKSQNWGMEEKLGVNKKR